MLQEEVDRVVDTHALRHGDPATEALDNICCENLPKPGLTDLMRAATERDIVRTQMLIESGISVNATDSRGWTALMYAAASSYNRSNTIDLLLQSGADAAHVSPYGDTVLMADAHDGSLDLDWKLSGNINAQNRAGVTALMLLVIHREPKPIQAALQAGADPTLRDSRAAPRSTTWKRQTALE